MQSNSLTPTYTDFSGFAEMRAEAQVDPNASLKQVAKQFESIFIGMMLKSMREASMGDPIFDSNQSEMYRDMFDKQLSLDMANGKGIGFADALVRQLGGKRGLKGAAEQANSSHKTEAGGKVLPPAAQDLNPVQHTPVYGLAPAELPALHSIKEKTRFSSAEDFTQTMMPYAQKAAKKLGVSPLVLVAQAALETGWGKGITRKADGTSSYNVFNIKANNNWQGKSVMKPTLEYSNGHAKYEKARFRAYDSYAESFNDYVDFLQSNHRYGSALLNQGNDQDFIQDLHAAGYATDPDYADKVINIMKRDAIQAHADKPGGEVNV